MPTLQEFIDSCIRQAPAAPVKLSEPVPVEDLPTPALTVDLDIFETNLDEMQQYVGAAGLGLRPHAKTHKCPIIARRQIEKGALGICTATVSEAEVMQYHGIQDILVTSPVVTAGKIERLLALAQRSSGIQVVVDHHGGADKLNRAAASRGVQLNVIVDLDPGMGRTGIQPDQALGLGRHVVHECTWLNFGGLQMYAGDCMHIAGFNERRDTYSTIIQKGVDTKKAFEDDGIEVPVLTGGGTGTYGIEHELGALTDIQAGSYIFMDVEYRRIGDCGSGAFEDFGPSLMVLVTAVSKPQPRSITVDAGYKSFASDTVAPEFRDVEGATFHWGGDEHGIVRLHDPSSRIDPGDKLLMLVSHCDPTVNLYDYYYVHRDGVVEEIWPITARGRSQ